MSWTGLRALLTTGGVVIAVAAALLFGVWYQFFRDDAPEAVSLDAAVAGLQAQQTSVTPTTTGADQGGTTATTARAPATATTPGSAAGTTTEPATVPAVANVAGSSGAWMVSTGSFVGYRVNEELTGIGATKAVGRTLGVTGGVTLDGTTVTAASFTVDLTTLASDNSRRDGQLRRQALESDTYPTATFEMAEPIALGSTLEEGASFATVATGNLTLHGAARSVEIALQGQLAGGCLVILGSLEIAFTDYGIDPPRSQRVIAVEDTGIMEFQLILQPA